MEACVYFDTDTVHKFAETFKNHPLADDLRDRIIFSPVTMLELFAHLATHWGQQVHDQINGLHNWVNKDHTGLLPWMDDAINAIAFGVQPTDDTYRKRMKEDLDDLLNTKLPDIVDVAKIRRDEIAKLKTDYAVHFQTTVDHFRTNPFTDQAFTALWVGGIKTRVGQWQSAKSNAEIVAALSAYHEFDLNKLKVALANSEYNAEKHKNDLFDSEQLIYLGALELNFLALDSGYIAKVVNSPFKTRIHHVEHSQFETPDAAEAVLRKIVGLVSTGGKP